MTPMLKPLDQQVIVITGASSGIGLATAEMAAQRGAKVVLACRSEQTITHVVDRLNSTGCETMCVVTDVCDRQQMQHVADAAIDHFGRIDTWVNNAAVSIYGRLDQVSDADHRRLFDINFWGVVNGSLVALQHLKSSGGALINIGSEVSEASIPLQGMYTASKHAVKGFTDALRLEIENVDTAPVSITLIQPTAVNTPLPQHARNYMDREPKLPDPKIDPERVASVILRAATSHQRDVKVGVRARVNTAMAKFAPGLADRMAARYVNRQQRDEPPRHPEGTLYEAGEAGRIRGELVGV